MPDVIRSGRVLFATLKKSWIKKGPEVQRTLILLGFKRRLQTVAHPDTPYVRGQLYRCRHLLDVVAEDATRILQTGHSEQSPLPLGIVPVTKELLNDERERATLGPVNYERRHSPEGQLRSALHQAQAKARRALAPEGYPLHPPPRLPRTLPQPINLYANKVTRELPQEMVVKPNVFKSRLEWDRVARRAPWFGGRPKEKAPPPKPKAQP